MHLSRWSRVASGVALVSLFAVASSLGCKGKDPEPPPGTADGTDDPGTTPSGGSTDGTGGTTGGTTTPPETGNGSGTPTVGICDAVAQSGCTGTDTKCGLVGSKFNCQAATGTVALGGNCTITSAGDDCSTGLVCAAINSTQATCHKACKAGDAASCPTGYACSLRFHWNGGSSGGGETFDVCVSSTSQCDPTLQNCANTAHGCYVTSAGNQCLVPETPGVAEGGTCAFANDCAKGQTCLDVGGGLRCYTLCSLGAGGSSDADGGTPMDADGGTPSTGGTGLSCAGGKICTQYVQENFGYCK